MLLAARLPPPLPSPLPTPLPLPYHQTQPQSLPPPPPTKPNATALTPNSTFPPAAHCVQKLYFGEKNSAADKLLGDFRKGYLGSLSLEAPPRENAAHNRLPLKATAIGAMGSSSSSGGGVSSSRDSRRGGGTERGDGEGGAGSGDEGVVYGAAAKEAREFVGTGDFEGW